MSPAREVNIAMWARLYRLLGDRDEYMLLAGRGVGERVERTRYDRATCLSAVDAGLVVNATEADRVCAAAVRILRRGTNAGVTEMLTVLNRDRQAAVALALPEGRRTAIFGPRVESTFELDADRLRTAEEVAAGLDAATKLPWSVLSGEDARELAEFDHQLRRRDAGLPAEFTAKQLEAMNSRPHGNLTEFLATRKRVVRKRLRRARRKLSVVK